MTLAVSGSSAMTSRPAVTYMMPLTTSGVTCSPPTPVSNVHAGCRATLAGVIWHRREALAGCIVIVQRPVVDAGSDER
jgi:hypothetical protein